MRSSPSRRLATYLLPFLQVSPGCQNSVPNRIAIACIIVGGGDGGTVTACDDIISGRIACVCSGMYLRREEMKRKNQLWSSFNLGKAPFIVQGTHRNQSLNFVVCLCSFPAPFYPLPALYYDQLCALANSDHFLSLIPRRTPKSLGTSNSALRRSH